ncbi:Beta-lactamase class C-like and penicillin binding proteins (PBPs) superfamily [hydrothermal vent metagenome]|uniref:Beta-lactamase class C-like and penicillin binding proteins (PBPs) superfamily n=1 Tax=hydrothermal vent metagenome TaxID=652676 RepID=A0A3B0TDS5_9ZZZZ
MKNPIRKYLKNLFAAKRAIGDDMQLKGLLKADALLNRLIIDEKIPGLAITVLKEGKPLLQKGYGYVDLEKKTGVDSKTSVFRIASVSKPIAATALAYMVAEGHIDLDASIYKYVPYFPKKKWDFTIRQLAGHTAGIRGYRGKEYGLNKPYAIKESIKIFKDDDLLFEPGTDYLYNSFDWALISLAMQEASGMPFETYVRQKVLDPLGMTNTHPERPLSVAEGVTSATLSDQVDSNKTIFYSKSKLGFRKAIPVNNFYKLAGGGYLSTTEDIAKLGQAYLDRTILDEVVLSQFLTSEIIKGEPTYYGLGWQVSEDKKGRPYYGHVGNGVGGYSNFFVYPEQKMVFAILVNCTNPDIQEVLDEVVEVMVDAKKTNT